jgi:hypothetical protein
MSSVQDILSPVTISNYGKNVVDGVVQHNPFWRLLKEKGQIEKNVGGDLFTWNLESGRYAPRITSDDEDLSANYTPRKRFQRPQLNWGQIVVQTRFSKGILRQNNGMQALVKLRNTEIPAMFRDGIYNTNGLHYQILNQAGTGYTGTGLPMFGLPSAFTSVTYSATAKEGTVGTGTYAGLSCQLSGLASSVDGAEPDSWTPTAVNTTANVWANTTTLTFRANVFEILTYGLTRTNRFSNNDPTKRATCFLLTQSMFTDLGSQIEGKQTYFITKKVGSNEDQGLGSNVDQLWHGGIPVYWDENLPANTGYCTNLNQMGLKIQPLVEWGDSKGEGLAQDGDDNEWFELDLDFNSSRRSMLVAATLPGQFWFNPRFLTQFYAGA